MVVTYLVYKIEEGELIVDSLFPKLEDAEWKRLYLMGKQGQRRGEPSLGDYQVKEVVDHGN